MLEYQTAVVRRDFETAASILPAVPREEHNRIARFLEAQGFISEALAVATDPEHQFELALQLGKLQTACEISMRQPSEARWKQLGDLALLSAEFVLAEECLVRAADLPGLLLLYCSTGHADGVEKLAHLAKKKGKLNISFLCSFLRGETSQCLELLLGASRTPDAALLARTYSPSQAPQMVQQWRQQLCGVNPKVICVVHLHYHRLRTSFRLRMRPSTVFRRRNPLRTLWTTRTCLKDSITHLKWRNGSQSTNCMRRLRICTLAALATTMEVVMIDPSCRDRYAEHAHDNEIDLVSHVKLLLANEVQAGEAQLAQSEEPSRSAQSDPAAVGIDEEFLSEGEPGMVGSLMHDEPPSVQHNSPSDTFTVDAYVAMDGGVEGRQVHRS